MSSPIEKQNSLELRDIHKSYDGLAVLRGVSLTAKPGTVTSIIGSSGSGKSTLLRCANLLETSQGGDIIFGGEALRWQAEGENRHPADKAQVRALRQRVAMVFQQFNLWTHMTILDNVIEAPVTVLGKNRNDMREIGRELLAKVGIADKADAWPAMLSGGQQQRAAIARALAMNPEVILFDEPTSALDPELEAEVVEVVLQLARDGRTMIMVTHDMQLVRDISDHVIFLHEGLVEEEGNAADMFTAPKSSRLSQFLRSAVTIDNKSAR
ncbi:MAG: amino acid ABC transporter ATP-binding protein [Alphaproteobacteria bacterium]|nr:amino acid ABC transporter ATP-binding protein [Alphaproteobacteria bacterium]NDA18790.1 amino acid ABC transporter ATP-binding protein [Alphaproteobacteria bacterium]NDG37175.1 amino acid ABC transporter ATP-binding protein [Alphaproteobacteria bacterium]